MGWRDRKRKRLSAHAVRAHPSRAGRKALNLADNDVSTWRDGLKARAGRAHARLKSIGVPLP